MLWANHDGVRVDADDAARALHYICPECARTVVLKKGRIRIAHFAHKTPTNCRWAQGETTAHREAKRCFQRALMARGIKADVEFVVPSLPDDRRADVIVWLPNGKRVAIELQHTSIDLDEIERRALSYAREDIAQMWLPFLDISAREDAEFPPDGETGTFSIERYSARPFERWIHGFHFGQMWFWSPGDRSLWLGSLSDCQLWIPQTTYYKLGMEETAGGYNRVSKRWKRLTLRGPFSLDQVRIKLRYRHEWRTDRYTLPACQIGEFVLAPTRA